jgi:hypothetical protein
MANSSNQSLKNLHASEFTARANGRKCDSALPWWQSVPRRLPGTACGYFSNRPDESLHRERARYGSAHGSKDAAFRLFRSLAESSRPIISA